MSCSLSASNSNPKMGSCLIFRRSPTSVPQSQSVLMVQSLPHSLCQFAAVRPFLLLETLTHFLQLVVIAQLYHHFGGSYLDSVRIELLIITLSIVRRDLYNERTQTTYQNMDASACAANTIQGGTVTKQ